MRRFSNFLKPVLSSISHQNYISNVAVAGSGLMGSGIAQVSAQSGYKVKLFDLDEKLLGKAMTSIETSLGRVAKKKFADDPAKAKDFVVNVMSNIQTTTQLENLGESADLVIEAIIENMEIKHKTFKLVSVKCFALFLFTM